MSDKQCPGCGLRNVGPIKKWRRNTSYVDDELNLMTSCVHCIMEDDVNYAHQWADYYNGTGVGGYSHYTDFLINRRWPWRSL